MREKITVPKDVASCCGVLRRAGHRACPVGGCVRDSLLGLTPGDWDVTTSAPPEEILTLFPGSVLTGGAHGTVTVPTGVRHIEITPFRGERGYSDGRHPDEVMFGVSLEEDLARRDFTINAMALDEGGEIIDPFGGKADLEGRLIRCVGEPEVRFREDALRMFRAVRFSAQLGFAIEEETLKGIDSCAGYADALSAERVGAEVEKTLYARYAGRGSLWFGTALLYPYLERHTDILDLDCLELLPAEPVIRWAGFCAALAAAGLVEDVEGFLKKLRRPQRTVRLCIGALDVLRNGCPADERGWRRALSRHGEEPCRIASVLAGDVVLERTMKGNPCIRVEQLALSGGELAGMGLRGAAIGEAQRLLLSRVLDRPEDNTKARLAEILNGTHI